MRIGFENSIPHDININAPAQSIENDVSIISEASLFFFLPLYIENRGVPPLPNKLANAVIITITGKHIPTAPIAVVPIVQYISCLLRYTKDSITVLQA